MLILLLRIIIFASVTLWSFLTRLIFSAVAYLLVMLIQGFKVPGEAVHGGFQQLAGAIRACFEFLFEKMVEAASFLLSSVFDLVKESVTSSVGVTGSVVGGLAEKMKTSFEEALKDLPELLEEISDMASKMVTEMWNNYKEAVGYVTENA